MRINKVNILEVYIARYIMHHCIGHGSDRRPRMQELVQPFLRCGCTLDHAGRPAYGTYREHQQVDIDDELNNKVQSHHLRVAYVLQAADHDGEQGAEPYKQRHGWKIQGLHLGKRGSFLLVLLAVTL